MIIFETSPTTWKQTFLDKSIDSFDSCRIVNIIQHMDKSATKAAYNDQKNKRENRTMVDAEDEAGKANKTEIKLTMVEPLKKEAEVVVVEAKAKEEVKGGTTTTAMVEEVVATTTEAEVVEATTMDIRTTSIRGTNNTPSHISSNKCLQQFHCLIQQAVRCLTFKATTWTAMQIKPVTILTVANGATKGSTGPDQPDLVQRALLR